MLKRIFEYVLWTIAALLLGIVYMYLIIGPAPEENGLVTFTTSKLYFFGMLYVGSIIGAILAALFIPLDVFYLKRKWQNSQHAFLKRAVSMLFLLAGVGVLHYLLEKTFDVI